MANMSIPLVCYLLHAAIPLVYGLVQPHGPKAHGPLHRAIQRVSYMVQQRTEPSLKELNLYFNIMNVKLCLLNQEMSPSGPSALA